MNEMLEEFEELTSEFLFGTITPEKENRLKSILKSSPELEIKFKEYLKLHSKLVNSENIWENINNDADKKLIQLSRRKNPRHIFYAVSAAALTAAAVILSVLYPFSKEKSSGQKEAVSYFSRVLSFYSDCRLNGKQVSAGMEIQDKTFTVKTGKHSYCRTESAGGHRIVLELEPESEMNVSLSNESAEIRLLKGKLKIDSEKLQNNSILTASAENLKIEFLGTKLFLESDSKISTLTVLKGSVRASESKNEERIISENSSERFNHSKKLWTSVPISDAEKRKLKQEFDELNPVSPEELKKEDYKAQPASLHYSRRISEKINTGKISQISGKRIRLKNGKSLSAETIFQEEDKYIIITKDDIFTFKDSEIDAILFQ